MKRFFFTIFILFIGYNLLAQVNVSIDTNIIELGNQTNLTITAQTNGKAIVFPEFKNNEISENIGIAKQKLDTIKKNPLTIKKNYTIAFFDDSVQIIKSFPVLIGTDTFQTPEIKVFVTSVQLDSATAAKIDTTQGIPGVDVKEPMTVKFTFKEFEQRFGKWILYGILALAIIALIVWLIIRYKKNKPLVLIQRPLEPPHIIALRNLDLLKEKKLFHQGKIKEYYSELITILRIYIEQRFRIFAVEQTSSEILESFDSKKIITKEQTKLLTDLLFMSDMAKFAKFVPSESQGENDWQQTKNFVEQTMEVEQQVDDTQTDEKKETEILKEV